MSELVPPWSEDPDGHPPRRTAPRGQPSSSPRSPTCSPARPEEERFDQVVGDHGTLPNDALYFALKPASINLGEVDLQAMADARPQTLATNPEGRYRLFRVGDAWTSRNIHAAMLDSLRLCKDL